MISAVSPLPPPLLLADAFLALGLELFPLAAFGFVGETRWGETMKEAMGKIIKVERDEMNTLLLSYRNRKLTFLVSHRRVVCSMIYKSRT